MKNKKQLKLENEQLKQVIACLEQELKAAEKIDDLQCEIIKELNEETKQKSVLIEKLNTCIDLLEKTEFYFINQD